MSSSAPPETGPLEDTAVTLGWGLFFCRSLAASVEVFLHRGIGERYLGWQAAAVLVIVPLFGLGWEGYDQGPMMLFLMAFLFMCFCARISSIVRRVRGRPGHTFYTGWPRIMSDRAKWSEMTIKRFVEPLIVLCIGFLFLLVSPPLGAYLMTAAVGLFMSVSAIDLEDRTRALDMHDAVIHQEVVAERFRDMRGERW